MSLTKDQAAQLVDDIHYLRLAVQKEIESDAADQAPADPAPAVAEPAPAGAVEPEPGPARHTAGLSPVEADRAAGRLVDEQPETD